MFFSIALETISSTSFEDEEEEDNEEFVVLVAVLVEADFAREARVEVDPAFAADFIAAAVGVGAGAADLAALFVFFVFDIFMFDTVEKKLIFLNSVNKFVRGLDDFLLMQRKKVVVIHV